MLVADDSAPIRRSTLALLKSLAHVEVLATCENGRHAVETALRREPDVVLLDLQMPVMSGLEAAAIFRDSMPHVGVIMMSMQNRVEVREACLCGGADAFIAKDELSEHFSSVLDSVMEATRAPERHLRAARFVTRPLTDLFAPARPRRARAETLAGTPGRGFAAWDHAHD